MAESFVLQMALETAIEQLVRVIKKESETDLRFESILNNLKSTLDSAYPKIKEICELRESNDLQTDELHRLLHQMKQARKNVDKHSKVACWNCRNKGKYRRELLRVDASLRNFFLVNLPIDQYMNTTQIQVQLNHLKIHATNPTHRVFYQSRYKVSDAASELKNVVWSLPCWIFHYLRSVMRITSWVYQRFTSNF